MYFSCACLEAGAVHAKSAPMAVVNMAATIGGAYVPTININGHTYQIPYKTRIARISACAQLLHNCSVEYMAQEAWSFIIECFPEMRKAMEIPVEHRLYPQTGWTAMAVVGGRDSENHKHKDVREGNWPGVLITLGEDVIGGITRYWVGNNTLEVTHEHLRMQACRYGRYVHEGTPWLGARYCVSYFVQNGAMKYFLEVTRNAL